MKFVDFTGLFEGAPADLALFSTFQFDPDFFERRLLRCPALAKARRIAVFMDAGQWSRLLRQDAPARLLNRHYLVVPVRRSGGVFHPKLNLLVTEAGGLVQCGSNNLTRSGCTTNLELLNSIPVARDGGEQWAVRLAQEAYAFFARACDEAEEQIARIARQWLDEQGKMTPWVAAPPASGSDDGPCLLHTYHGRLWDRIEAAIGNKPSRVTVISPFYDTDAEMVQRVRRRWPKCRIELVAQQHYTTLPVASLKQLRRDLDLFELTATDRRVHAKFVAWESGGKTGGLVGSANFTTAAFDARNVEACLLLTDAADLVRGLFDGHFGTRAVNLTDFVPGTQSEPGPDDGATELRITSAVLTEAEQVRVSYRHRLDPKSASLRLTLRTPAEPHPRAFLPLPNQPDGTATVTPTEAALKDAHGTLLASLVADVGGRQVQSDPVWVVQEARLTHEPGGEGASSPQSRIEESGEGLAEFLDEMGKRDGVGAVIDYLQKTNIRFYDGEGGLGGRRFRLRIRDPFRPDVAPAWLLNLQGGSETLAKALCEFADRHEDTRLRKHAKRGNINGIENFLDILTALVRLLYVYYTRGHIQPLALSGRVSRYIQLASCGIDSGDYHSEGYLLQVDDTLGNRTSLREECGELNFLGQLWAALVIAQKVRFEPNEAGGKGWTPPKRPKECLPHLVDTLRETAVEIGLDPPTAAQVTQALGEYNLFLPDELAAMQKEMPL